MGFNSKSDQSNESIKQFFYQLVQSVLLMFESMEKILMHGHAQEIDLVVLSSDAAYYTVQSSSNFESVHEIQ